MVDGPLQDVRILDLTHVWAGPLAVRYLADLGADVVRVEAPFGRGPQEFPYAPLGGWLGGAPGDDPWNNNAIFVKLMRNRRSVCLDLKVAAGKAAFLDLVKHADVVMENFSAAAMAKLGLGYAELAAVNPQIIAVGMPGFGASGPMSQRVAFGPTVEAMSGLTEMFGYSSAEPRNTAMALMDPINGVNATAAVMSALHQRRQQGRGCRVEMSLHEGGVAYSGPWLIDKQLNQNVECLGNRHPNMVPHGVFACRGQDQWVAIACADQGQWQALATLLRQQGWGEIEPHWDLQTRRQQEPAIERALASYTRHADKHEITLHLQQAGVSAGPVNNTPEMLADEQTRARGFFVPYERHATPMPGNPIKMSMLDSGQWQACPSLGADNHQVLSQWLGYSDEQIAGLITGGVLHDQPPG